MKSGTMKRNTMMALAAFGALIGTPAEAAVRYQYATVNGSAFDLLLADFIGAGAIYNQAAPAGSTCAPGITPCDTVGFQSRAGDLADFVFIGNENDAEFSLFAYDDLRTFGVHNSLAQPGTAVGTLSVSQVNAAPEPAGWAMLILGFGLAGWALRRRAARPDHAARRAAFA